MLQWDNVTRVTYLCNNAKADCVACPSLIGLSQLVCIALSLADHTICPHFTNRHPLPKAPLHNRVPFGKRKFGQPFHETGDILHPCCWKARRISQLPECHWTDAVTLSLGLGKAQLRNISKTFVCSCASHLSNLVFKWRKQPSRIPL